MSISYKRNKKKSLIELRAIAAIEFELFWEVKNAGTGVASDEDYLEGGDWI